MNKVESINLQLFAEPNDIKTENKFLIKNEVEDKADIYLYGTIREAYPWEDEDKVISSKRVRNALEGIGDKDIDVYINSGGGDVFESIAIHNILKQHKGQVNIIIDSLAGSGASVIAMAGDTVKMFDNSMMMIHKAWTIALGNSDELRKQADDLEKIDSAVEASYKSRFVGTEAELSNLIKDESWLTFEECEAFGFCDKLEENSSDDEPIENNIKENLFNKYKKDKINSRKSEKNKNKSDLLAKFRGNNDEKDKNYE